MQDKQSLIVTAENGICTLEINNVEKHNALTPACLVEMSEVLDDLGSNEQAQVVVIRGSGEKAFSAGFDITAFPRGERPASATGHRSPNPFEKAMQSLRAYPYPTIAMLNGFAFGGGCELAISCDIRIAAEHVRMGMPAAKIGLVYRYEGFKRFLKVLGYSRTLEIFLTARSYDSRKCIEMGLVNHVVAPGQLSAFTYEMAGDISSLAPLSLRHTKSILNTITEYPHLKAEDREHFESLQTEAFSSRDHEEGKRAFVEKRKPRFQGR